MSTFEAYTDGSCLNNPGKGGYASIIWKKTVEQTTEDLDITDSIIKTISGKEKETTNNRMELQAVIETLKYFNSDEFKKILLTTENLQRMDNEDDTSLLQIKIYTDSRYVMMGVNEWIAVWVKNKWKNIKNTDLWNILITEDKKLKQNNILIRLYWVEAHIKNNTITLNSKEQTFKNNLVDKLAQNEAKSN